MRILLFLFSLFSVQAWAASSTVIFEINGENRSFYQDPSRRLLVSQFCVEAPSSAQPSHPSESCEAMRVLKHARIKDETRSAFLNPATPICLSLNGIVVVGRDSKKNENSFCKFRDGSMLDNGTLFFYARQNSKKVKAYSP